MAARLSPTSNLLRKSRLFALPPTLSPPAQPASSSQISESDTATLPYPIRAAIATPDSSLLRGDWGLKRSLPAKSTIEKSSTPVVRINALDTYEHVTDFESAGDHTKTLAKWQELSLPISVPKTTGVPMNFGGGKHESVFESNIDNTHKSSEAQSADAKRFRFGGPWLAGQTDIEFDRYLASVRRRKPEFMKKLRQLVTEEKFATARRTARDEGKSLDDLQEPQTISDEEFGTALRRLRANPKALGPIISKFLDLPPPPQMPNQRIHLDSWSGAPSVAASTEYGRRGPPKTHPSAGLSYLRTGAQIDNHPVAGPQEEPRPVLARILRPKRRQWGNSYKAVIGVGGIVTEDINAHAYKETEGPEGITNFDPDVPGGAKYWVHPVRASVTSQGKINLSISRSSEKSRALYAEMPGPEEEPLPEHVRNTTSRSFEELNSSVREASRASVEAAKSTGSAQDILNLLKESKKEYN
ncbi:hypothetical protein AJ79_03519 [Helicocarpus griseus UAMH5409]|uniref:Mitochondrial ribosomal protein MRP51 n=1 Tax=Helicocarpus griseus UAMH5409 TaxID=1447875 RepID=A0A2B7XXB5_9EURO|nr:hypothetical protein AJ79_03519 [Helicocarpus griseus UAMH5409]